MTDKQQLDNITTQFFNAFTSSDLMMTDLNSLRPLFIKESYIYKACGTPCSYTFDEFILPRQKILTDGTLLNFKENEIKHSTVIFGDIAQRRCIYEKSGSLNKIPFKEQGVKMFSFIKIDHKWKIASILWEDERTDLLISHYDVLVNDIKIIKT